MLSFRFLRQPSSPNAPRPVAKSGVTDVRFTPNSGHFVWLEACPLSANSTHL